MARVLAMPLPRVSWKWAMNSAPGKSAISSPTRSRTRRGLATPVVSPSMMVCAPSSR